VPLLVAIVTQKRNPSRVKEHIVQLTTHSYGSRARTWGRNSLCMVFKYDHSQIGHTIPAWSRDVPYNVNSRH